MLSRTFDVSRRLASSRPELCYRVLRSMSTATTSEGSTSGMHRSQPPQYSNKSQNTAYIRLKDAPRSIAEAFFVLGTLERKYGTIEQAQYFADPDLADHYKDSFFVVFKNKEALERVPKDGERLYVAAPPTLPTNGLDIRLSDLEAHHTRADYDPLFHVPTTQSTESKSETMLEMDVKHASYDQTDMRGGHSNPIPPRQILRAFGDWGGFSKLEPTNSDRRITMRQLFTEEPPVDNHYLRFALQSYKENTPGMAAPGKESSQFSGSSSTPFDVRTVLSSAKQASKSSQKPLKSSTPRKESSPSPSVTPAREEPPSPIETFPSISSSSGRVTQPTISAEERAIQQAALDRQIEMAKQLLKPKVSQASKQPKQMKPKIKIVKRSDLEEAQENELDDIERLIKESSEAKSQPESKGLLGAIWGLFGRK